MCIAIYSVKGNPIPDDKTLKNCWYSNDDGAGFAFAFNNRVEIRKGFMTFEDFLSAFHEYDSIYNFKNCGVLIHFRIATHGGTNKSCCHPFPLSGSDKQLKKTKTACDYAVIHNGVIGLTSEQANKEKDVSDTMVFIRDYLTKIASNKCWFYNDKNFGLIGDIIESKMAILNAKGEIKATEGFELGEDGNFYSNDSYMGFSRYFANWGYDYGYGLSDYDTAVDGYSLMRLKPNETIFYDDGTTEEYDKDYHKTYPSFLSVSGNIYACYDGKFVGKTIDTNRLSFIGTGCFVEEKDLYKDEFGPIVFRNDVTVFSFEDVDDIAF